ncbi:alanyl-tRNA editing protein [Mesoaciditoga lauensis]|uniref:alanyl-tRNA editing protein n=1 Tax=Mesoaciditoga lauensis TaxID=1495039 RepID=UPI0012E0685C|nr:alanyl-tRNA editing protein [Mesoaciditoga lauensis]
MKGTHFTKPTEAEIEVLKVWEGKGKYYAELASSPFYPDGFGGQIGDRGFIGEAQVLYVPSEKVVEIDKPIEKGTFLAKTDIKRREEIARQHTAQHILSAAMEKLFDAQTVGFHMGEDSTTVDIDSDVTVDFEKVMEVSNDVILSDLEVKEIITSPEEAKNYDLRKLSDKAIKSGEVRIIKIGEFDLNACGGFHVSRTGEIGSVRITHSERVKGNLTRIWFVAGKRALNDCLEKEKVLNESSRLFDASWRDLKKRIEKTLSELKEKNSKLKKTAQSLGEYTAKEIKPNDILKVDEIVASYVSRSRQDIPYLLIFSPNNATVCIPQKSKEEVMKWARNEGFKGGGKGPVYRFAFDDFSKFKNSFLDFVKEK